MNRVIYFVLIMKSVYCLDLCNYNLSVMSNATCYEQLPEKGNTEEDCYIVAHKKNSDECADLPVDGDIKSRSLGRVHLKPYLKPAYGGTKISLSFTAFNVSFSDIKWKFLRLKFVQSNSKINFCRDILLTAKAEPSELFYDCIWETERIENSVFEFSYEASDFNMRETGKYIFQVPERMSLESLQPQKRNVMIYVEVQLPHLIARWSNYGINTFHVTVKLNNESHVEKTLTVENYAEAEYKYDTNYKPGNYSFEVLAIDGKLFDNNYFISTSPQISVSAVPNQHSTAFVIIVAVIIFLFLITLIIWRRGKTYQKLGIPPKVLLVYLQSYKEHLNVVQAFARYMKDCCNIEAYLDENDVPNFIDKDPSNWYNEMLYSADCIIGIASPPKIECSEVGIYCNMNGFKLLAKKCLELTPKQKLITVQFPYTSSKDIPIEVKNYRRFLVPKDLDSLLWHIHHGHRLSFLSKLEYFIFKRTLPGSSSMLEKAGVYFLNAISEAQKFIPPIQQTPLLTAKNVSKSNYEIVKLPSFNALPELPALSHTETFPIHSYSGFPGDINNFRLLGSQEDLCPKEDEEVNNKKSTLDIQKLIL